MNIAISEECYDLLFERYGVPTEITTIILNHVRLAPIIKRSREMEEEKLVCWKGWYEDGSFRWEKNYKNGELHGVQKWWYKDGPLWYERNYQDGKPYGVQKWWYENGFLEREENYKDGKPYGVQKCWYEDGSLRREENYQDGKLVG